MPPSAALGRRRRTGAQGRTATCLNPPSAPGASSASGQHGEVLNKLLNFGRNVLFTNSCLYTNTSVRTNHPPELHTEPEALHLSTVLTLHWRSQQIPNVPQAEYKEPF